MKTQSYQTFWQRIHKSAPGKGLPLRVMFELTYRCNFSCRHCYIPLRYRKYKELKTKEVFSIVDQLRDSGCFYLGFTGGEPFIRNDIMQILCYAKKSGFQIIIYTNGSLIDKKQVKELVQLMPNKVDITIPAMDKAVFERITGLPASRDKVFRTIALLHKNGVPLGFKTCVLNGNASQIKDIQDFAASLGALHRLDDTLSPCLDGQKKPYLYRERKTDDREQKIKDSLSCQSQLADQREQRTENKQENRFETCKVEITDSGKLSAHSLFKCGVGMSQAAITPLGELKMCLMIDYPKYKINTARRRQKTGDGRQGTDLKETWKRLKQLVASIKPDQNYQCAYCGLRDYCKWCPAKAWLQNRTFTYCDLDSRRWAESRKLQAEVKV